MKSAPPTAIRKILDSNAEVFIRAVDAGRAIGDALRIDRMEAMRMLWEAQKAGTLRVQIINGSTCVDARGVRALIKNWRTA